MEDKEKTKKKDFIELEFTARIKESGIIFDTNIKEDAKIINLPAESLKPLKICIGEEMVVKGLDKELDDKEIGKKYFADVKPEEGFGMRNSKLIRTVSMKMFIERNINPVKGLMLNMDGMIARIASVSGGRVMVDFNNPLAGKKIKYEFTIKKIIKENKEKLMSLAKFFCGEEPKEDDIKIEGKKAEITLKSRANSEFLKKKIKEILELETIIKKKEEKKEVKNEENRGERKVSETQFLK